MASSLSAPVCLYHKELPDCPNRNFQYEKALHAYLETQGCDCGEPVTEVIILLKLCTPIGNLARVNLFEEEIKWTMPLRLFFGTFDDARDAIVNIRLHFEFSHKNFLPFGITDAEALALLKKGLSQVLDVGNNS